MQKYPFIFHSIEKRHIAVDQYCVVFNMRFGGIPHVPTRVNQLLSRRSSNRKSKFR